MAAQIKRIGWGLLVSSLIASSVRAGYYNTADAEVETRWSLDYEYVFRDVLSDLQLIPNPKPERDPRIRKRYVMMDLLGRKGAQELKTLEQKLDYSAVLLRLEKPDEAFEVLKPLTEEHAKNFLVWSHYATACFLLDPVSHKKLHADFYATSAEEMQRALELWPERWDKLDKDQQDFLKGYGWEETAFARYRRYETYFQRLMRQRIREARKKAAPAVVDSLFVDEHNKPVRFVNETGAFEVGRIAETEWKKLPKDAIEAVEQQLIWLPNDARLFWLLGEVFNASAMGKQNLNEKNQMIRNASLIFEKLLKDAKLGSRYALKDIKEIEARLKLLEPYVEKMKDPRGLDEGTLKLPDEDKKDEVTLTNQQWWRTIAVSFITGFAVGMFALWQFRELRRRRQARLPAAG